MAGQVNGYYDRVLRVNLSSGTVAVESRGEEFWRRYLGGRGFIAHTLISELEPGIDPLGPENKLIFAPGPVTGFSLGGNGRHSVGAKSPLTGGYGDGEAGGFWGAEFRWSGFDAIIVEGQAEDPVYIWIHDGEVEIRPAEHLWGKLTADVQETIAQEVGDSKVKVLQCGIAGENRVRMACTLNDVNRAAGRAGMGAVMGSKNLKAVAVRGTMKPMMADRAGLMTVSKWLGQNYKEKAYRFVRWGTPGVLIDLQELSGLPTRNFNQGQFEGAAQISGETMHEAILTGRDSCYACPIRCKQVVEVKKGKYKVDPVYGGPEYESLAALGSNCGVSDLVAVAKANELCAAYGLDTIGAGATIAMAMECFERGILTTSDADGIELRFGNADAVVEMVHKIARRDGLGDLLAEGSVRAARQIGQGAEEFVMHVKGQEVPMHEPRLKQGLGLGYMVSPTGADHMHNIHDTAYTTEESVTKFRQLGLELPPLEVTDLSENKVRLVHVEVNWKHFVNSAVICLFLPYDFDQGRTIINAITGWDLTNQDCLRIGERAANMMRVFNLREGLGADTDVLPKRFYKDFEKGPLSDVSLSEDALMLARETFYRFSGWDPKTGVPTAEKLQQLDLDWLVEGDTA